MSTNLLTDLIGPLRRAVLQREAAHWTDGQLLERYLAGRDDLLFEALVERHGPMIFGVCRRLLGDTPDAEDAFQATFLVLVRKAASVRPASLVGNWLYGVAYHTARRARSASFRRQVKEKEAAAMRTASTRPEPSAELAELLDQELGQLPDKYRTPIVLCDLEGKTRKEAARHLGWPEGTVAGRLARARVLLAKRLGKRGVTLSGGVLGALLAGGAARAGVPAALAANTVKAAALVLAGKAVTGVVSTQAAMLAEGVVKTMLLQKLKCTAVVLLALGLVTFGGTLAYRARAGAPPESNHLAEAPPPVGAKDADRGASLPGGDVKADASDVVYLEDNVLRGVRGGKLLFESKMGGEARLFGSSGDRIVILVHKTNAARNRNAFPGPDTITVFSSRTGKVLRETPLAMVDMPAPKVPPQPLVVVDPKGKTCWFVGTPLAGGKTVLVEVDVDNQMSTPFPLGKAMSDSVSQPLRLGAEIGVADYYHVDKLDRNTGLFVSVCKEVQYETETNNLGRFVFVEGLGVLKFRWQQNKVVQFTDKDLKPLAKPVEFKLESGPAIGRMEFTGTYGDKTYAVAAVATDKTTRIEAIDLTNGKSLWKKELDFRVTKIAPGANGAVLLVAPGRQAILKYDPWAWTDDPVKVAKVNAEDHWLDGVGLITETGAGKEESLPPQARREGDKAKESRAVVIGRQSGRGVTFGAGLNTHVEGLALAVLGSCSTEGEANKKGWLAALDGDHVLVTYSKPRLVGVGSVEEEFPALEILLPMSSTLLPDHVWVRYEDKYRKFAKYTPQAAMLLQEFLKGINQGGGREDGGASRPGGN